MKFKVTFRSDKGGSIDLPKKQIGLFWLDEARKMEGGSGMLAEDLNTEISSITEDVSVIVNEDFARQSKRFEEDCTIVVNVNKNQFNDRVCFKLERIDDSFQIHQVPDVPQILLWWKETGFKMDYVDKNEYPS